MNRMTVIGLRGAKSKAVVPSETDEAVEMMEVGLGCATMQGLELDNWLQSKNPSSRILEMLPSTRYPVDLHGRVVKRMSMLSQLSGGRYCDVC